MDKQVETDLVNARLITNAVGKVMAERLEETERRLNRRIDQRVAEHEKRQHGKWVQRFTPVVSGLMMVVSLELVGMGPATAGESPSDHVEVAGAMVIDGGAVVDSAPVDPFDVMDMETLPTPDDLVALVEDGVIIAWVMGMEATVREWLETFIESN